MHPDRMAGKSDAEKEAGTAKFKELNEANEVLLDREKRQLYDSGEWEYDFGLFGRPTLPATPATPTTPTNPTNPTNPTPTAPTPTSSPPSLSSTTTSPARHHHHPYLAPPQIPPRISQPSFPPPAVTGVEPEDLDNPHAGRSHGGGMGGMDHDDLMRMFMHQQGGMGGMGGSPFGRGGGGGGFHFG